jgi:phage terminase small subunit
MKRLTAKAERFCLEAVRPGNTLSDAYRTAYRPRKSTPKTINEEACRLAANPKVAARIAELRSAAAAAVLEERSQWLKAIWRCATFDIRRLFGADGKVIDPALLDDESAAAIAGVKVERRKGGTKIRLVDRLRALELYGKAAGFYVKAKTADGLAVEDGQERSIKVEFVGVGPDRSTPPKSTVV